MNEQDKYRQVRSPCVSTCEYNENYYCIGCKRHMDEIIDWLDYSDEKRNSVMQELLTRDIDKSSDLTFRNY